MKLNDRRQRKARHGKDKQGKKMRIPINTHTLGAAALLCFAIIAAICATSFSMGEDGRMGPGSFPLLLSLSLVAVSFLIFIEGVREPSVRVVVAWRPLVCILGSVGTFIVAMTFLGLIPSVFLTVLIGVLADSRARLIPSLVSAGCIAIVCWALFIVGLGLPISAMGIPSS